MGFFFGGMVYVIFFFVLGFSLFIVFFKRGRWEGRREREERGREGGRENEGIDLDRNGDREIERDR